MMINNQILQAKNCMGVKFQQGEKTHKTLINNNIGGQERRFA